MRRQKGIDVADGPAEQALLDRRDLVLKALALGGGALAAAALAPSQARADYGDEVHVGEQAALSGANEQIAPFMGLHSGAGPGLIIAAMKNDTIQAEAWGANKSVLYAYHHGDGWGVYAVGRRAGVFGKADLGPGVKGFSSAGDGIDGESGALGKSGVYGHHSGDGWGVVGSSAGNDGVKGQSTAPGKAGVYALNDNASGNGVYATGGNCGVRAVSSAGTGVLGQGYTGVWGDSGTGTGVYGNSAAAGGCGVEGQCTAAGGTGCRGVGQKVGVAGYTNFAAGTAVHAENFKGGVGLDVVGKTKLQRSGVAATVVGKTYSTVTVPGGVTTASKFLVTMQGNPGAGVFVTCAQRCSPTQFRVYFNKACKAAVKFAWMVLD